MSPLEVGIIVALISCCFGFLGKVLLDHYQSGRVEKGVYMRIKDFESKCNQARKDCCVGTVKKTVHDLENEMSRQQIRQKETDKQLDRGREDFRLLRDDIGEIKEALAGMKAIMENKIEKITLKPKRGS